MPGWMQRDFYTAVLNRFTILQRIDFRVVADASAKQVNAIGRGEVSCRSAAGVIGMGVGDDVQLDRFPRIDVEITG